MVSSSYSYMSLRDQLIGTPTQLQTVLEDLLKNIRTQSHLNAFVRVYETEARQRVHALTQALLQGNTRKLTGMMVGMKDLFCYQDHPVQASSRILTGFISQITATAITRLLDQGVVLLGHQNCDEFGMGSSNTHSVYGPVMNAIQPKRVSGGSSGGSAVAVQAGMCHLSLGTDTGGSVRQPAAFCGIIGLKPTYGRISRYGVIAYGSSFDTVGILSRTISDCAAVLQVIAGKDPRDNTSSQRPVPDYTAHLSWKGQKVKVGYLKEALTHPGLQKEIQTAVHKVLQKLKKAGHQVASLDFPLLAYALPTYYVLVTAEASANLARYDGVRYGYRAPGATSLEDMVCKTRSAGFGKEVKRRLLLGAFVLDTDYHDTYYTKAQKVRRKIKNGMEAMLADYDYLICPTTPTTAFPHDSVAQDPVTQYLADLYTVPASVAGLPAISIPIGSDADGMPIGLQIIGAAFKEEKLLAFAQYLLETHL